MAVRAFCSKSFNTKHMKFSFPVIARSNSDAAIQSREAPLMDCRVGLRLPRDDGGHISGILLLAPVDKIWYTYEVRVPCL